MPAQSGTAGRKADPNCSLQEMEPVSLTARLARKPRTCPKAVHICHVMTRPPRIEAGAFSEAKTGIVVALSPMPIPINKRVTKSCAQVCAKPDPITGSPHRIPEIKIVQRRPVSQLTGSANQTPIIQDDMKGAAFTRPTIQGSIPSFLPMFSACGNERLAPLEPV